MVAFLYLQKAKSIPHRHWLRKKKSCGGTRDTWPFICLYFSSEPTTKGRMEVLQLYATVNPAWGQIAINLVFELHTSPFTDTALCGPYGNLAFAGGRIDTLYQVLSLTWFQCWYYLSCLKEAKLLVNLSLSFSSVLPNNVYSGLL